MAFRTTITEAAKGITVNPVFEATTPKLLKLFGSIETGVYGKAAIMNLDLGSNIIDLKPDDSSNRYGRQEFKDFDHDNPGNFITTSALRDEASLCTKALEQAYLAYCLSNNLDPLNTTNLPMFVKIMVLRKQQEIALAIDRLVWQGNKDSENKSLKPFDGILKQASKGALKVSSVGGIEDKLFQGYCQLPVEISSRKDCFVFVGEDAMKTYIRNMKFSKLKVKKSKYGGITYVKVHDTPLKMVATNGLNGSDMAVATRLSNLWLGISGDPESEKFTLKYNIELNWYELDFFWTLGITVIDPSQVAIILNLK